MLKKIQVILLYLTVFTLPFQRRYIFNFNTIKKINGFREHLAVSFYSFDIFIITLLLIALFSNWKKIFTKKTWQKMSSQPLFFFIMLVLVSFLINKPSGSNWYNLFRLLEMIFLFIVSRDLLKQHTVRIYTQFILFIGGTIQATIAILQFIYQRSIGLKWLGENIISPDIHGIAKFSFEGEKFIRAYGTFPHPNVLGIFLLFSLASGLSLVLSKKVLMDKIRLQYRLIFLSEFVIILVGILLTYSRAIIAFTFLLLIIFALTQKKFISKRYKQYCDQLKIPFFLQTTLAIILIFGGVFFAYNLIAPRLCIQCSGDASMHFRKIYRQTAELIILKHPFLGIGLGNFVPISKELAGSQLSPWRFQPVHNLYLLIASELGLVSLFLFLLTIFLFVFRQFRWKILITSPLNLFFLMSLLIAFFDHYFWTIPQGQIIFWLAFALASVQKTTKIDSPKYHFKPLLQNFRKLLKELS